MTPPPPRSSCSRALTAHVAAAVPAGRRPAYKLKSVTKVGGSGPPAVSAAGDPNGPSLPGCLVPRSRPPAVCPAASTTIGSALRTTAAPPHRLNPTSLLLLCCGTAAAAAARAAPKIAPYRSRVKPVTGAKRVPAGPAPKAGASPPRGPTACLPGCFAWATFLRWSSFTAFPWPCTAVPWRSTAVSSAVSTAVHARVPPPSSSFKPRRQAGGGRLTTRWTRPGGRR